MATIWVVEGSQTVQRMVEIALTALPVQLVFGAQVSDLIGAQSPTPSLLVCAQRFGAKSADRERAYVSQAQRCVEHGISCPMILLVDQRAPDQGHEAPLNIAGVVRKPFKTQSLVEVVARALELEVPHASLFDEKKRVIPLARSTKSALAANPASSSSAVAPHPVQIEAQATADLTAQIKTPTPSSVGSLMNAVTPVQRRPSKPARPLSSQAPPPLPDEGQDPNEVSSARIELTTRERDVSHHDLSPLPLLSQPAIEEPPKPSSMNAVTPPQKSDGGETAVDTPALKISDVAQASSPNVPSSQYSAGYSEAISAALSVVRVTTDRALEVVQRAQRAQAEPLSPAEQRALIERIAWEVVPAIATEVIKSELAASELRRPS